MSLVVYHHPFTRAATVVWMLEEIGVPHELRYVDGDVVVTEGAAIGLYLADRYAPGKLAPALDDPARGTYLRWSLFAPSVIEPGSMAKAAGWAFKPGSAGWGDHESMVRAMEQAVGRGDYLLDTFSMADIIFGATVRYMIRFKMLEATPALSAYADRLAARPALQRAEARNAAIATERGLT
jgi:glutathione S-transferase